MGGDNFFIPALVFSTSKINLQILSLSSGKRLHSRRINSDDDEGISSEYPGILM